jgi:hypothetical protein
MKNAIIVQLLTKNAFKSNMVRELDSIFSCYDTNPGGTSLKTFDHQSVTESPEYALSIRLLNLVRLACYVLLFALAFPLSNQISYSLSFVSTVTDSWTPKTLRKKLIATFLDYKDDNALIS